MKQTFDFEQFTPPVLNERILRRELEKRAERRRTVLLAVAIELDGAVSGGVHPAGSAVLEHSPHAYPDLYWLRHRFHGGERCYHHHLCTERRGKLWPCLLEQQSLFWLSWSRS